MIRLWMPLVVLALTLGITSEADAAPRKVDWSSYLEDPSDRRPSFTAAEQRPAAKTSAKKRTADVKKSKAKKSKAKAKAKRSAKKRRR